MFPARAGMNRHRPMGRDNSQGVPRTRGDEPAFKERYLETKACSPHARG